MNLADAASTKSNTIPGAKNVIRRFTLRRAALGATIFGLFAAAESVAQGLGLVAAYPNAAERTKVVYGLANNAALGLFYGDKHANIASGAGYMVYRILDVLTLIGAIWSLLFITKMLRGQEENGRWELLLSGRTSAAKATAKTIMGAGGGLVVAYIFLTVILAVVGRGSKLSLSLESCLFYGLAVMTGAAMGTSIGAVTSQLAATRRRAVLYGVVPIIVFFAVRSVGNVVDSLAWLKNLTPFGWIDKLHPFYHSQPVWLLPLVAFALLGCGLGVWLAVKRDMAESFIADSAGAKPRFGLLNSQLGFDFRLTRGVLSGWLFTSVALAALIAAIDKTVAQSLSGTSSLTNVFSKLTGNPYAQFEIAYLSAASYFVVIILMIMMTTGMGAAREEEASSRLDNFVSGTVSRRNWLGERLVLLIGGAIVITVISNLVVWVLADAQGIHTHIASLLFGGLNVLGPVIFLLGFGVLLFGLWPRVTTIGMYVLVGWSFTSDIVASVFKASKLIADTSLLHYISLVPAASPQWTQCSVLTVVGLALTGIGMGAFQRRDLEVE
jgi:ABC-2 type transport system permease protein